MTSEFDLSANPAEQLAIVRDVMTNQQHDVWPGAEFDAWFDSIVMGVRERVAQEIEIKAESYGDGYDHPAGDCPTACVLEVLTDAARIARGGAR